MKFQINVSQYDIDNATRKKSHGCMVHRAFMRATDGAFAEHEVRVDGEKEIGWFIQICRNPHWEMMFLRKLPGGERLDEIIEAWDAGYTVEPFTFWIDLPEYLLQPALFPTQPQQAHLKEV